MNLQLVLGSEDYAVTTEDAAIALQQDVRKLKPGSYAFLLDGATVYTALTDMGDVERVQLAVGLANPKDGVTTMMSVPIRRRDVLKIDREGYAPDVVQVVEIDLATVATDAEGEVVISLFNNSYDRTIKLDRINAGLWKKKGVTAAQLATAIALKVNTAGTRYPVTSPFVTAAVSGTKVQFTMANSGIDFNMTMDGLVSGIPVVTVTPAKVSLTNNSDILRTEQEYSGNLGNGGYVQFADMYYSVPQQTNMATQYDVFHIKWQGEHDTPQNKQRSAVLWLKIAVPTAKGDAFAAQLKALFSTSYDQALGSVEPVKDKKFEADGNPAT